MNKTPLFIIVIALSVAGIGILFIFPKEVLSQLSPIQKPRETIFADSPFGMHGAFSRPFIESDNISQEEILLRNSNEKEPYRHVQDIGVKWIRPGTDIYWALVQPTKEDVDSGSYDWSAIDSLYGRVPSGVYILANICPGRHGIKPGTWQFISEEVEQKYLEFVKKLVERYDGDGSDDMPGFKNAIKYWQIENEPAVFFEPRFDPEGFSHLVEITYRVIKENDPEARISLGGLAGGNEVNNAQSSFYPVLKKQWEEFYLPLLKSLYAKGIAIDMFDIHYYGDLLGWPSAWGDNWKDAKDIYNITRRALDEVGYRSAEIWFTETSTPSQPIGERAQALSLIKRYIYFLSLGVKKIFWWNMIEGEAPLADDGQPTDSMGLIYDGIGKDDPGYGVTKLSYYTYKKMVEILEGSDWNNIQTIQEKDGIYIYRFIKDGKPIWAAWNDNPETRTISLNAGKMHSVKVTEAVPRYETGKEVADYNAAFETQAKTVQDNKITLILNKCFVFVEEK